MSEQSKVPTAAELRGAAQFYQWGSAKSESRGESKVTVSLQDRSAELLLAGAAAMERADRLEAALLWVQSGLRDGRLVCRAYLGHNRSERAQDWFLELKAKIDAALAQEGGA